MYPCPVPTPALNAPALTAPPSEEETNEAKAAAVSDLLAAKREAADEIAVRTYTRWKGILLVYVVNVTLKPKG